MFKYLFKALLDNGQIVEQNQEDKGSVSGKNCFYDVLCAEKEGKLRAFAIYNQETLDEWLIDLCTCTFEHNVPTKNPDTGEIIYAGEKFKLHGNLVLHDIRLIWFLERSMELDIVNNKILTNQIKSYNFGFQANDSAGQNHKFIITLG